MFDKVKFVSTSVILAILTIGAVSAYCNNGSVNVAFVPNNEGAGGGELPINGTAFQNFSFTFLDPSDVNATTLANYDTLVLAEDVACDPPSYFTQTQLQDIVNWVYNGGKLIIYDSECYSGGYTVTHNWLPTHLWYTVLYPGALGADKESYPWVDLKIVEDNTLSSNNPGPYFVNVTMIAYEVDAAGDQNVFIANGTGWCADMIGTNAINQSGQVAPPGTTGFSHVYTHYGKGLIIYNGLDIDELWNYSDPTSNTGEGHLAKIWLLELKQPWDNVTGTDVCGLPCSAPVPPPIPSQKVPTLTPIGSIALICSVLLIATISLRRK